MSKRPCLAAQMTYAVALIGFDEHLVRPIGESTLARRPIVEISNALFRKPRVLILDGPIYVGA